MRARLYAATVRSVLTYNTEHWGSNLVEVRKLCTLDRRFLRAIVNGWEEVEDMTGVKHFRPWANDRLYRASKLPPLDEVIARRFHRWVGHVLRMDRTELPAASLLRPKPAMFKRRQGGQCMTWRRRVLRTYQRSMLLHSECGWELGVALLKRRAANRSRWCALAGNIKFSIGPTNRRTTSRN